MGLFSKLKGALRRDTTQSEARKLIDAVKCGDSADIRQILRDHPGLVTHKDDSGRSLLHMTDDHGIAETLIVNGAQVNAQDVNGLTPLHHAAKSGNEAMVQQLIVAGADTSIKSFKGVTAADMARENGHDRVAAMLTGGGDEVPVLPHTSPAEAGRN